LRRPERLYGRAEESATLMQLWQRATRGSASLCLLSGEAGMGKSALVQALQPSVQAAGGLLARAQFAARPGAPAYGVWLALCRSLLQALPLGAAERQTLGVHLPVLGEALPDLARSFGPPPPPPPLSGLGAQRRLHAALLELLTLRAQGQTPLLLFLDDLQWADAASLALLRDLLQAAGTSHLLLLGAYREEPVDASHPVTQLRRQLSQAQAALLEMHLAPLNQDEVAALLTDGCTRLSPLRETSTQLMQLGQGNPGRCWQLLQHWVLQGRLYFDRQRQGWHWAAA
jgi:predicted ATPase